MCSHKIQVEGVYPAGMTSLLRDLLVATTGQQLTVEADRIGRLVYSGDGALYATELSHVGRENSQLHFTVTIHYGCDHVVAVDRWVHIMRLLCDDLVVNGRVPRSTCRCPKASGKGECHA